MSFEHIDFRDYKDDFLKVVSQTSVNLPDPEILADKARGESHPCGSRVHDSARGVLHRSVRRRFCDGSEEHT